MNKLYEDSRELGTMLYRINVDEIETRKITKVTKTMFEAENIKNGWKAKWHLVGNTWFTKEGIVKEANKIICKLQKDIKEIDKNKV